MSKLSKQYAETILALPVSEEVSPDLKRLAREYLATLVLVRDVTKILGNDATPAPNPFTTRIALDVNASRLLRDTIGRADWRDEDNASEITLIVGPGASGFGLYVYLSEYPEEGAILLKSIVPDVRDAMRAANVCACGLTDANACASRFCRHPQRKEMR